MSKAPVLALLLACACNTSGVAQLSEDLTVSPDPVAFDDGWVGFTQSVSVVVLDRSAVPAVLAVSISGPFSVDTESLQVPAGQSSTLIITYRPLSPGHHSGSLVLGSRRLVVTGNARSPPSCESTACSDVAFDTSSRACAATPKPDGTSCQTACATGSCQAGACVGNFNACDDHDPCSVDSCSETNGCGHTQLNCAQPADPCQIARCDSSLGCATDLAPDGTTCAVDSCLSAEMHVCIQGQCSLRPRPASARCSDTWAHPAMLSRYATQLAYDSDRQRVVMFGGASATALRETWEWDGTRWTQLFPAHSPAGEAGGVMVYDAARKRMLQFGGGAQYATNPANETWEWNGTDWTQLFPAHTPDPRDYPAMAYDSDRQVVVLFGGGLDPSAPNTQRSDTWEWDGIDWSLKLPANSPSLLEGEAMVYDPSHHQMVMVGAHGTSASWPSNETWLWDGQNWQLATAATPVNLPSQFFDALIYDPSKQRVVLVGSQLWEWDGASWVESLPGQDTPLGGWAGVAFDEARSQVISVGGIADGLMTQLTWVFDGSSWSSRGMVKPPSQWGSVMAYDGARQRTVLVGCPVYSQPCTTWEWDGSSWQLQTVVGPAPQRMGAAMAYDSTRQVLVLFGGDSCGSGCALGDTWEYDGSTWVQRQTLHAPPARSRHAMAFDSARGVTVLFGGSAGIDGLTDTWEWDGTDWTEKAIGAVPLPPARIGGSMAYDSARGQTVLVAGRLLSTGSTFATDLWTWDGQQWVEKTRALSPPGREHAALLEDSKRHVLRLLGGVGFCTPGFLYFTFEVSCDAWTWDGNAWTAATAPPRVMWNVDYAWAYDEARDQVVGLGDADVAMDGSWGTEDTWIYAPP